MEHPVAARCDVLYGSLTTFLTGYMAYLSQHNADVRLRADSGIGVNTLRVARAFRLNVNWGARQDVRAVG